jgi:hypothetical protein
MKMANLCNVPGWKRRPQGRVSSVWIPTAQGSETDERGQFRLVLPPGKFYIRAVPNSDFGAIAFPEIRSDGRNPPVYGPTWYPGTESKDHATLMQTSTGREVAGIDIRFVSKRSLSIHGVVTGLPNPDYEAFVSLFATKGERVEDFNGRPVWTGTGGRFTVTGLAPGRYRLQAQVASLRSRSVEVQLDNADENGVSLTLQESEALSGKLEIEGVRAEKLNVRLTAQNNGQETKAAEVGDDGAFRIDGIFPEKYQVRVSPLPGNAYVKSVKIDDIEAAAQVLDFSQGVAGARIRRTFARPVRLCNAGVKRGGSQKGEFQDRYRWREVPLCGASSGQVSADCSRWPRLRG